MNQTYITQNETEALSNKHIFTIENGITKGKFTLQDVGEIMPGAVMVHDLKALSVPYMNNWGCNALQHSLDDLNLMGEEYYQKFFKAEEVKEFLPALLDFYNTHDETANFSFFHQVRTGPKMEFGWYYAVCKFLNLGNNDSQLILVANPVSGMGKMVQKFSKLLDENEYVTKNYNKFALLTKREKEIIKHLANGKSTMQISDELFLSHHTISTHRKNINNKLGINSFMELLKFAIAFELVK